MANATINPVKSSPVRDTYKFGNGPEPVLQPGTMGWSAADLEDPEIAWQYEQGRHEILDGVLTVLPAAFFFGGQCVLELVVLVKAHLKKRKTPAMFSAEVDIQVKQSRLLRADAVAVFGDDLPKFKALKFKGPNKDWRKHALIIPPTPVIESVSEGHELHDKKSKRSWYAGFGVRHYWIVDGFARTLECLLLNDGRYLDDGIGKEGQVVSPASLSGLHIPLAEVCGE